jgi:hypothetical protein
VAGLCSTLTGSEQQEYLRLTRMLEDRLRVDLSKSTEV